MAQAVIAYDKDLPEISMRQAHMPPTSYLQVTMNLRLSRASARLEGKQVEPHLSKQRRKRWP
jgi:hypothetical protein